MLTLHRQSRAKPGAMALNEAIEKVARGELTLIDVRDMGEMQRSGRAEGAIHIPLAVFRMKVDPASAEFHPDLALDRPVALYCASGARSQMAAELMLHMGFTEVYNLGGLSQWQQAGGPVTRP
ncbi:MAG: rhodanese-like domain-containing protein [Paracoccaceae bacterium]